jgi:hypothetical protein
MTMLFCGIAQAFWYSLLMTSHVRHPSVLWSTQSVDNPHHIHRQPNVVAQHAASAVLLQAGGVFLRCIDSWCLTWQPQKLCSWCFESTANSCLTLASPKKRARPLPFKYTLAGWWSRVHVLSIVWVERSMTKSLKIPHSLPGSVPPSRPTPLLTSLALSTAALHTNKTKNYSINNNYKLTN